ncbi:hypothetical protein G7Y89_g10713 [Cudoniella acicularis]|uniref:Aminoglycoside phosphotransferase domain-containing protein n=1 Tax=Cudoniella acicularis TaxID=354080 RepID=A0A8H4REY4_9HELO|nr:hypothetical protein G7Y89_g10713 [Cudoniella acicularis]
MPSHYIEFDKDLRKRTGHHDLPAFRNKVRGYAVELVQSYAGHGFTCTILETVTGGFHICVILDVVADREAKKWVLRVPIPWEHAEDLFNEKFQKEIAQMKHISANTKWPIPRIIAFGFWEGLHPGGDRFMLEEHMPGTAVGDISRLSDAQRNMFYSSLSDLLLELWKLPFPRIGSIGLDDTGEPDASNLTRPLVLEFNNLELDGTSISAIIPPNKNFETPSEYFLALADLHMEHLLQQRNSIESEEEVEIKFINRFAFRDAISTFTNSDWDVCVLIPGDLSPENILIDDDGRVTAILDLEWTSVRPVQCIGPPVWLTGDRCGDVIVRDKDKLKKFQVEYDRFVEVFKRQENLFLQAGNRSPFQDSDMRLSRIMEAGLSTGNYWFTEAAESFYGFDGLIPQIITHQNNSRDSHLLAMARWVGNRKLKDLRDDLGKP